MDIPWLEEDEVRKLLKTSFGLLLNLINFDIFLQQKINKKLNYWYSTIINTTSREVIVNNVLLYFSIEWHKKWYNKDKNFSKELHSHKNDTKGSN